MIFLDSFTLLQLDRLQLTTVYCNRHDNKIRIWTRSGKTKIMFEWVTKHNANANDDMYACVTLHDTNVNDIIHACVALHNAHTCNHIH